MGTSMLLVLRREADHPPIEHERLSVADDGSATGWRSTGAIVGRLAGVVPDPAGLRAAVEAALASVPPALGEMPPGAAVELLEAGAVAAVFPARREVPGAWGTLLALARTALDALSDAPVAAVTGSLVADRTIRLEHRGDEPLELSMAGISVEMVRWLHGRDVAHRVMVHRGEPVVVAAPGWHAEVPLPELDPAGGGTVAAAVGFAAHDGTVLVPVTLTVRSGG